MAQLFTFIYMNGFLEGENKQEYTFPKGTKDARGDANATDDGNGDDPETESSSSDSSNDSDESSSDTDDTSDDSR